MAAPKGNQFWKARSSHGRKPIFAEPEQLWEACLQYFEGVAANPLQAAELVKYQGLANVKYTPRMRAMTIRGLCIFLDIGQDAWRDYAGKDGFSAVCTQVGDIIAQQKFEGAAAEMLNPSIIARDLGLAEKKDIRVTKLEDLVDWEEDDGDHGPD